MPRPVVILAACALLGLSACSSGPSARDYARKACTASEIGDFTKFTSMDQFQSLAQQYVTAAHLAAQAANADPRWNALEQAESGLSDLWGQVLAAAPQAVNPRFPVIILDGQQMNLDQQEAHQALLGIQNVGQQAGGYETTIRAECLKANA